MTHNRYRVLREDQVTRKGGTLGASVTIRQQRPSFKSIINTRWLLFWYALPILVFLLFVGAATLGNNNRFDATYFAPEYVEHYDQPGETAAALATAVQTASLPLFDQLYAQTGQIAYQRNPNMEVAFVNDATVGWKTVLYFESTPSEWSAAMSEARFLTYVYTDNQTYKRTSYVLEHVAGRWVVTPLDARYYWLSGRWAQSLIPLGVIYFVLTTLFWGSTYLYRANRIWLQNVFPHYQTAEPVD